MRLALCDVAGSYGETGEILDTTAHEDTVFFNLPCFGVPASSLSCHIRGLVCLFVLVD